MRQQRVHTQLSPHGRRQQPGFCRPATQKTVGYSMDHCWASDGLHKRQQDSVQVGRPAKMPLWPLLSHYCTDRNCYVCKQQCPLLPESGTGTLARGAVYAALDQHGGRQQARDRPACSGADEPERAQAHGPPSRGGAWGALDGAGGAWDAQHVRVVACGNALPGGSRRRRRCRPTARPSALLPPLAAAAAAGDRGARRAVRL